MQWQHPLFFPAEEAAKVYPELVTRGAVGKVESGQYHQLIPMPLNGGSTSGKRLWS